MILVVLIIGLLAGIYVLTLASFAWEDVTLGVGLASVLLMVYRHTLLPKPRQPVRQTLEAIVWFPAFALASVWNIVTGSWAVARIVLGIRPLEHPGIVVVPLGDRTPTGVGLSQMLLTMSPGSFLVDVDWDQRTMLIHVIDASDPDKVRDDLQSFYHRFQRHVAP